MPPSILLTGTIAEENHGQAQRQESSCRPREMTEHNEREILQSGLTGLDSSLKTFQRVTRTIDRQFRKRIL